MTEKKFDPFAGGGDVGGTSSSKERPSLKNFNQPRVAKDKETNADYCVRVLAEHNNLESDISVTDPYWKKKHNQ